MKKLVLPSFARFDTKTQDAFVNNLIDRHFASREFKINKVKGDETYDYIYDVAHGVLNCLFSSWIDDIICCANLNAGYAEKRHEDIEVDGTDIVESYRFQPEKDFTAEQIANVETEAMELAYAISTLLAGEEFKRLNSTFKEAYTELVKCREQHPDAMGFWHAVFHQQTQLYEDFVKVSLVEKGDCYALFYAGNLSEENYEKMISRSIDSSHEFFVWANGMTVAENYRLIPKGTTVDMYRLTDEALSNLEGY